LEPHEDDQLKTGAFMAVQGKKRQTDRHVEAVLASCEIMDSFLRCPNQTMKQIIEQTKLTRNRVMRLAGTLEARGYLHRDSRTGSYGLGTMFMSLGRVYESQSNVGSLGQSILQQLARTTGESASIYVRMRNVGNGKVMISPGRTAASRL
jgi:DNA-binding IclR family transcriptional regulator